MRINNYIPRAIITGILILGTLTAQAQQENMDTILDIHHILAYLVATFMISVFVMVFYNRLIYFKEKDVTKESKRLIAQLSLIMDANKTETWTYNVENDFFTVLSEDETKDLTYLPIDFSQAYDREDFYALQMAINAIKNHNGVIVADVVGLGKSIIASTVARNLRLRTLVVCPPHLEEQWRSYRDDFGFTASIYTTGKLEDALKYYERIVKADEQYLIVVDEAHRYRNEYTIDYTILHQLCSGNKVMLLTATPFNNRPDDIYAMLKLFQIPTKSTLKTVDNLGAKFKDLIITYKQLRKDQREGKKTDAEVSNEAGRIANEIRSIISPLVIRRSRIDLKEIPEYAEDLKQQNIQLVIPNDPIELDYDLSSLKELYLETLDRISEDEGGHRDDGKYRFKAARYSPVLYLKEELRQELSDLLEEKTGVELNLLFGRQANVAKFMRRLLVRRFESSEFAFRMSLEYMIGSSRQILKWIEEKGKMPVYKKGNLPDVDDFYKTDDDGNDLITETYEKYEKRGFFEIDMKYIKESFVEDIKADMALLLEIQKKWFGEDGTIMSDPKLESFKGILDKQLAKEPQRKIIVFTEFADTADYLGESLQAY